MKPDERIGSEVRWLSLAGAAALVLAPLEWPYGYYQLLRLAVTALAVWLAIVSSQQDKRVWTIAAVGVALLYNPLVPVYLSRETWLPVDLATAVFYAAAAIYGPEPRNN